VPDSLHDNAKRAPCPGFLASAIDHASAPPSVVFVAGRVAEVSCAGEHLSHPQLLDAIGGWTLMGVFEHGGTSIAVFEEISSQVADLAFVGASGVVRTVPKSLEPTSEGEPGLRFHSVPSWYRGHAKGEVLPDYRDILREELLADGREPTADEVAACYPAARQAFFEGHLRPHTFVGTGISADVVPLYYTDVTMVSRVPIGVVAPGSEKAMEDGELWEGLLGGWAPIVRTVYPIGPDACWEVVTFGSSVTANAFKQPVWYRASRLEAGRVQEVKYIDSFLPHPHAGLALAERFYSELLATLEYWDRQMDGGMTVIGWDAFTDRSRHAFAREMITRRGVHPKYGIADQAYAGAEHDGFQDVLVSSVLACLEWGYFDRARAYLDDYFTHFVRDDGTLHYRGPEMGKYGVSLTCLGLYYDYTRDASLLRQHRGKIDAVADMLLGRWRKARERDTADPAYGMIPGYHEADINFLTPNVYELDYDRPYLSNTGEAWRGLRDLGGAYLAIGTEAGDAMLTGRGEALGAAAAQIFEDARRGVDRSWITKDGVTGLPIIAGDDTFYWEHPYRARPESYDENRVWSELYFGGAASTETVRRIWDIAGERGHTSLGVFNNRRSLVGFLVWEEIAGLLQHDMIPEALLTFYAQAYHAHSRGTWTAIECVDLNRTRGAHSPYCLPAQMTVPIAMRWLLVYEDPVTQVITLGHGLPRDRLEHGRSVGVRGAPTRQGQIGFLMESRIAEGEVSVTLHLPQGHSSGLRVRLRVPGSRKLVSAETTSVPHAPLIVEGDRVVLPAGLGGETRIITRWA
jgi:hypothetical protein